MQSASKRPRRVRSRVALLLGAALGALGAGAVAVPAAHGTSRGRTARAASPPCGRTTQAPAYRHVVWILMENDGYAAVTDPAAAPFLAGLAAACGLATNYHAVAHPSLPNYISLTAGSTENIADDNEPAAHRLDVANLFWQLKGNWRALEESMPTPCDRVTSGAYAARHDPAVYYTNLGASCARNVVPLRFPLQLSRAFTFITPNICNDMHNCPVATGDAWLARVVPAIESSAAYRSGTTALFITWDESDTGPANQVATYVVAPSVRRDTRAGERFSAYSLLRTTEQLLHLRPLGGARRAPSMLAAFNL